jgi:hypothetical protein
VSRKNPKYKKKGKLESSVFKIPNGLIQKDENKNRYFPMCTYRWHTGVIKNEEVCIEQKCRYYSRYYLDSYKPFCFIQEKQEKN